MSAPECMGYISDEVYELQQLLVNQRRIFKDQGQTISNLEKSITKLKKEVKDMEHIHFGQTDS